MFSDVIYNNFYLEYYANGDYMSDVIHDISDQDYDKNITLVDLSRLDILKSNSIIVNKLMKILIEIVFMFNHDDELDSTEAILEEINVGIVESITGHDTFKQFNIEDIIKRMLIIKDSMKTVNLSSYMLIGWTTKDNYDAAFIDVWNN